MLKSELNKNSETYSYSEFASYNFVPMENLMIQMVTYNAMVGYELEKIRKNRGLDQNQLAEKIRVSQPVLSRLEKGKASVTIDQLFVICEALEVAPQDVIADVNRGVMALKSEKSVVIATTKEVGRGNLGAALTGEAIGGILAMLLARK